MVLSDSPTDGAPRLRTSLLGPGGVGRGGLCWPGTLSAVLLGDTGAEGDGCARPRGLGQLFGLLWTSSSPRTEIQGVHFMVFNKARFGKSFIQV